MQKFTKSQAYGIWFQVSGMRALYHEATYKKLVSVNRKSITYRESWRRLLDEYLPNNYVVEPLFLIFINRNRQHQTHL